MENKDGQQKNGKQTMTFLEVIAENKRMENKNGKQTTQQTTLLIYK
jgi:hypothetical protein